MGAIWGAPSPWLSPSPSVVTFTFTLRLRLQPPPSSPTPTPNPNPNPIPTPPPTPTPACIATRGLVLIPAAPLSRCDADREVLRQLWGGGVRVLPVLTKTDLLDQVILRGALVRGRSHLLVAVVVKLPCSTGQQKDAATLARVTPLSLRAHPSRLPTCPVHILPAPCTSYQPRAHGCTAACRWPPPPHAVPGATDELAHGRARAAHCRGRAGRTTLTLTLTPALALTLTVTLTLT